MDESTTWASRRKSIYLGGAVILISAVSFFIFWKFWYEAPTCSDGVRNGNERGVDCGGACSLICKSETIPPIVRWDPRLFEVMPNVWSAIVYVENPNTDADAIHVPYKFVLYDANSKVIYEREGVTMLPKNKTVGVFEGSITLAKDQKPSRTLFELGSNILWKKASANSEAVTITHSPILRLETSPRVEASVKNNSIEEIKNIELVAAIFDGRDNVIAASRTFVERLAKDKTTQVFFTWPNPFELGERACSKESSTILALDRSGSMSSVSTNPPEPLTSAKNAAASFVNGLKIGDKVGVVSFATTASKPPNLTLTPEFESVKDAISKIEIDKSGTQYTNIYEALHESWSELVSSRVVEDGAKVVVLLTDGRATYPVNPISGQTEEQDIVYAEKAALNEAKLLKDDGIEIYTIGLGQSINEAFLKQIASKDDNFFFAPNAADLLNIYKNISSDICKEVPARIEITYKILNV